MRFPSYYQNGILNAASFIATFITNSPFKTSPLSTVPIDQLPSLDANRLHTLLLAYLRLLTADPHIATRNNWPLEPLHILRTNHCDNGVRLLAVQVLSRQRGWSEVRRIEMESKCVGKVDEVDAQICYGEELVVKQSGGCQVNAKMADGWLLPLLEAQRIEKCKSIGYIGSAAFADA